MNELEPLEKRITKLEDETKELSGDINMVAREQVRSDTKLDMVLTSLNELKDGLEALKKRPSQIWDKVVVASITAFCGVIINLIV